MALKSLYRVCEIKKLDLISSFSVRSQNNSYKNIIVFRLARHLCSSTSLVIEFFFFFFFFFWGGGGEGEEGEEGEEGVEKK